MKSVPGAAKRHGVRGAFAGLTALALGGAGLIAASPAQAAEINVNDAVFNWGVNKESGAGAFDGSSNFLVAGEVGDAGSRVGFAQDFDKFYKSQDGNVTIVKPDATGKMVQANKDNYDKTPDGEKVSTRGDKKVSLNEVQITGGTGKVDPDTDTGEIQWKGSFTISYYKGMTYWTIKDPKLSVKDGHGKITATFDGFGSDMDDASKWVDLPAEENHTVADFKNAKVDLKEDGFEVVPDYLGVEVETEDDDQLRSGDNWGAFPQDWVDWNVKTGQSSYWYTSYGQADVRKPTMPVKVKYSAQAEEPAEFEGTTTHKVTEASADKGLSVQIDGKGYQNLPKASTGKDAAGAYSAIIDRSKSNDFKAADVLGAQFSYFPKQPADFSQVSTAELAKLDESKNYDAVVWAAHGDGTEDTVLYREPINLSDDQKAALWPEASPEPSETATEEPSPEPSETETAKPTDPATDDPTTEPTQDPTEDPTTEPTDSAKPTEDPKPTDDPTTDAPAEDVALTATPQKISAKDFTNKDKGVNLSATGLKAGAKVTFNVARKADGVDPITQKVTVGEDGKAQWVVYGTSAAKPESYVGEYTVGASYDEADAAGAKALALKNLSTTFTVTADDNGKPTTEPSDDPKPGEGDDNGKPTTEPSDDPKPGEGDDNGNGDNGADDNGTGDNGNTGDDQGTDESGNDDQSENAGNDNDGKLPKTGMELTAAGIGLVLLVIGGAAIVITRRKRA